MDSDDKASVLTFDSTSTVQIELTNDKDALQNSTSKFYSSGGTNFEEVINKSIDILENSIGSTRKYIILLSDGISSIFDDTLYKAQKANIKIFTIGLGNSSDTTLNHISTITEGEFSKAYSSDDLLALLLMLKNFITILYSLLKSKKFVQKENIVVNTIIATMIIIIILKF